VLTVQAGKRGRTRLVPLHHTAISPLADYAADREQRYGRPGDHEAFFRTDRSEKIGDSAAHHAFSAVRRQRGWTATGRTRTPRIHDLRHTMVVRRMQTWHEDGVNVDANIPVLATYLGHVEVRDLYWYLSAVPELMGPVAARFETFAKNAPGGLS
jgi:integrase